MKLKVRSERSWISNRPLLFCVVLSVVLLHSCSSTAAKNPPSAWAGSDKFLKHGSEMQEQVKDAPFHWIWTGDSGQIASLRANYHTVVVPPVDLTPLTPVSEDALDLGKYFHDKIVNVLGSDQRVGLQVADDPGTGAFIVQAAILDLTATKAVLNAVTSVAGFFVPGATIVTTAISAGASAAAGATARGDCAAGVQIRNSATNDILLEAADFRDDSSALLFDMKGFSQYAHSRESLDQWAQGVPWLFNRDETFAKRNSISLVNFW